MEFQHHFIAHKAWMMVLLGVLLLINTTWMHISWGLFLGMIAIILGILTLILHGCCRNCSCNTANKPQQMLMKKK